MKTISALAAALCLASALAYGAATVNTQGIDNTFTGVNTFTQPIVGSVTGSALTAGTASYATTAGHANTADTAEDPAALRASTFADYTTGGRAKVTVGNTWTAPQTFTSAPITPDDPRYYGAQGGAHDDTQAFVSAIAYVNSVGGGDVKVYDIPGGYNIGRPTVGSQRGIRLLPGVNLRGIGGRVRLNLTDNCEWIYVGIDQLATATITANTAITDTTLTVNSSAGFSVGDQVVVRIGQAAYDNGEPDWWYFAKVTAVNTGTITLDTPTNYALSVAAVGNTANRRVIKCGNLVDGATIENFYLYNPATGSANAEHGVFVQYAKNITVKNIKGHNVGAGILVTQFVDNLEYDMLTVEKCVSQGQASKGRVLGIAESKNVKGGSVRGENFDGTFYVGEAGNIGVECQNFTIINNSPDRDNTQSLITLLGEKSFHIKKLLIDGNKSKLFDTGGTAVVPPYPWVTDITMQPTTCDITDTVLGPASAFAGKVVLGSLTLGPVKQKSVKFNVAASQTGATVTLPSGRIRSLKLYLSSATGITSMYVGSSDANNAITVGNLVSNGVYVAPALFTTLGRDYPTSWHGPKSFIYYSDSTVPSGTYGIAEIEYFSETEATAVDIQASTAPDPVISFPTSLVVGSKTASNNAVETTASKLAHYFNLTDSRFTLSSNGSADFGLQSGGTNLDTGALRLGGTSTYSYISSGGGGVKGRIYLFTSESTTVPAVVVAPSNPTAFTHGVASAGTTAGLSGCSYSSAVGGSTAGKFVSGTTGTCTVAITLPVAATGWSCWANNLTTGNMIRQTVDGTATATISGTTVTGDAITWGCIGY